MKVRRCSVWGALAAALWCATALGEGTRDAVPAHARSAFRIAGVAVSSRDGTPIPFCRLRVARLGSEAPAAERRGGGGGRGGRDPGQFPPGQDGGPRRFGGFEGGARPSDSVILADSHGRFSLDVAGAGTWRLSGIARGFRLQMFEERDGYSAGIVLTEANPVGNVTFRLEPDAQISGLVLDEAGEGVANAQVRVAPVEDASGNAAAPGGGRFAGTAQTDDRGHYELAGLGAGRYRLEVQARPWYAGGGRFGGPALQASTLDPSLDVVYPVTWFPGTQDASAADVLRLAPGEDREADFRLQPVASTHLTLPRTDSGAADARGGGGPRAFNFPVITRVSDEGGQFGGQLGIQQLNPARSASGAWDIGGLTPGLYVVRLPGADGRPGEDVREIEVEPGSGGVIDLAAAKPLIHVTVAFTGEGADSVGPVVFLDRSTGRRVFAEGGRGFGRRGGDDDQGDGTRSVQLLPGTYEVRTSGGAAYLTGMTAKGAKVTGMTVQIEDGAPALTLQTADGRADVTGVAQAGGKGISAAMVLLVPAMLGQPGDASVVSRAETNTDGSFTIASVIPGPYILVAIDHGWGVNWHDPATLAPYLLHGVPLDIKPASRINTAVPAQEP